MFEKLETLADLNDKYDVILSDVWGVLHNGVRAYSDAKNALSHLRKAGKIVILITNSPRRKRGVIIQLEMLGITSDSYDEIVTSGELTRDLIRQAPKNIFFLGPDRDLQLLDGLDVSRVKENVADAVICTGLFDDEREQAEDYSDMLKSFNARDVPFICANPDLIVERGERMIPCAGAIADLYKKMGGKVYIAGKPHAPIYQAALNIAEKICDGFDLSRVIAIGDGIPTDIRGAIHYNLDLVFVAHGIHINQYIDGDRIDPVKLRDFLTKENVEPDYWMEWVK